MAQLKSTKVFGDLNVTGEVNVSTKITVNGEEVWDTGNLLNIGTTAATARTALGLGAGATRWPTFAEVTGKPATYAPSGHTHPISQVTGLDAALADKADKTTQVIAGTGLTGGGTLAANRTLAVSYGTAAGTAAQGNDSRLSNSREWTAGTISQAEAEAGTATTARKWTAQRVAQAISALGLKIGTTATTAKAGNWMPTWANVTGKPTTFAPSAHTHSLSQITDAGSVASLNTNASTANFLRGDGTWVTPPNTNTTYSEISTAEIDAGTASTSRTITGRRMKYALDKKADTSTQVIAGTGLTGGGTLAANRTLAVSYGTAAGTAAQGNDSRITGALQSSQVVQTTGTSTTSVMSQKVTTDQLATKAASSHTHPWAQVTGQPATATRWPTFAEVTGKPTNYPTTWADVASKPAQATRWPTFAEVTGKPTNYPTNWATVSNKPIVQTVGTSTTDLMSQKAVTDALEFRSLSLRENIKVTVGAGGDFPTINAAILHLSRFVPDHGVTAEVELRSGFVMMEQLLVEGLDLGWITITGVDVETVINEPSLTRVLAHVMDDGELGEHRPAFGVIKGTLPTIGQLFIFSSKGSVINNRSGVLAYNSGVATILEGCGVKNAGRLGISAGAGSTIIASGAIASGAGEYGIESYRCSIVNARFSVASGAGTRGVSATTCSTINADGVDARNAGNTGIHAGQGSIINAQNADARGAGEYGINATSGAMITAGSANCSGAKVTGMRASSGGRIAASWADCRTAGQYGAHASSSAEIRATEIRLTNGKETLPAFNTPSGNGAVVWGSRI